MNILIVRYDCGRIKELHVAENASECFSQVLHGIFTIIGTSSTAGWSVLCLRWTAAEERTGQIACRWTRLTAVFTASVQERIATTQDVPRRLLLLLLLLLLWSRLMNWAVVGKTRSSRSLWLQWWRNGRTASLLAIRWNRPADNVAAVADRLPWLGIGHCATGSALRLWVSSTWKAKANDSTSAKNLRTLSPFKPQLRVTAGR